MKTDNALVLYDAMVVTIEQCHRTDEVKQIRDKALALQVYARQAMNVEAERKAIEIRIRAERKVGQLLREMQKSNGGGKHSVQREPSAFAKAKAETRISDTQAKRWQKLAEMPQVDEQKLHAPLVKPSISGLIDNGRREPKVSDNMLRPWGTLKQFDERGLLNFDMNALFRSCDGSVIQPRLARLIPEICRWLAAFNEKKYVIL